MSYCPCTLVVCFSLVALATPAMGGEKKATVDQKQYMDAVVEALCDAQVLGKLKPILMMERSISNKKLSKAGYQDWLKERNQRWDEARVLIDPILVKHGIQPSDLIAYTGNLYENDTQKLAALRELMVERVAKECEKANKEAGLDFKVDDMVAVVIYGYRQD